MISMKHNDGFTLMVRCKCGWVTHIRCVNRATAVIEGQKIYHCPNCWNDDLTFIMKKGQFKAEELREAVKNELRKAVKNGLRKAVKNEL